MGGARNPFTLRGQLALVSHGFSGLISRVQKEKFLVHEKGHSKIRGHVLYLAFSHPRSQSRPQWAIEQEGGLGSGLRFVISWKTQRRIRQQIASATPQHSPFIFKIQDPPQRLTVSQMIG